MITTITRPRILVDTARIGARHYRPERDDVGELRGIPADQRKATLTRLETNLEAARRERSANYSPAKHVSVMAALLRS